MLRSSWSARRSRIASASRLRPLGTTRTPVPTCGNNPGPRAALAARANIRRRTPLPHGHTLPLGLAWAGHHRAVTLFLGRSDVASLLDIDELAGALRTGFLNQDAAPPTGLRGTADLPGGG